VKALLYIFGDIVMFGVALIALYWSFETVHVSWKFGSSPTGCAISQVWFLWRVPIGFSLVIFRLIQSFLRDLATFVTGAPSTKATSCSTEGGGHAVATTRCQTVELGWDFYGPVSSSSCCGAGRAGLGRHRRGGDPHAGLVRRAAAEPGGRKAVLGHRRLSR
jgi:hypothetical protein